MPAPHEYLLFTEALSHASGQTMWRFLLLRAGSDETTSASDLVEESSAARTELLAVVRGLEAIDGPANVRLFTSSDYIQRGFSRGLAQWRNQRWHWERFGRRVPIRDCDLWQRIDHALAFHSVESQLWGEAAHISQQLARDETENSIIEARDSLQVTPAPAASIVDESAVLVIPKRRQSQRRNRVAAATRNTLGELRRGVESLFEPTLLPAG
ncbi:hypothetical protein NG895_09940 [Aeoliella sp. ICT_H6.2]|uniref:RNase H type-1 domain-containing protein n=1 Tax=Aeoliella straminimaris TaxID=2954799 RepID=A0A9X2FE54_9BACT|nr:RNase H family protein [Aeoliella straminimaris]MCO6044226.1 hypothetical protein [Aeoliella straminimaris]